VGTGRDLGGPGGSGLKEVPLGGGACKNQVGWTVMEPTGWARVAVGHESSLVNEVEYSPLFDGEV
jgi:hypothetical protein